jgi:hypothetical protein
VEFFFLIQEKSLRRKKKEKREKDFFFLFYEYTVCSAAVHITLFLSNIFERGVNMATPTDPNQTRQYFAVDSTNVAHSRRSIELPRRPMVLVQGKDCKVLKYADELLPDDVIVSRPVRGLDISQGKWLLLLLFNITILLTHCTIFCFFGPPTPTPTPVSLS